MSVTFFIQHNEVTHKVTDPVGDMPALAYICRCKFSLDGVNESSMTFDLKDATYGVMARMESISELYDGAFVRLNVAGSTPTSNGTAAKEEPMKPAVSADPGNRYFVKLRGIPWSATEGDVSEFFAGGNVNLAPNGIKLLKQADGRLTGKAYVEVASLADQAEAKKLDREHIQSRYIEIYTASPEDAAKGGFMIAGMDPPRVPMSATSQIIKLKGLPYSTTREQVLSFLSDVNMVAVHMPTDFQGRPSGVAFVELTSDEEVRKTLAHHKEYIGDRFVETYRTEVAELCQAMGAPPPRNANLGLGGAGMIGLGAAGMMGLGAAGMMGLAAARGSSGQYCLRMQGLPFGSTDDDINVFFQAASVLPARIHRKMDGSQAYVEFYTDEEAGRAMARHKAFMGSRYIDLFRVSYAEVAKVVGLPPKSMVTGMGGMAGMGMQPPVALDTNMLGGYGATAAAGSPYGNFGAAPGAGGAGSFQFGGASGYGAATQFGGASGYGATVGGYGLGGVQQSGAGVSVRMIGIPWSASQEDIYNFFSGFDIIPGSAKINYRGGRPDGTATVLFASREAARLAVQSRHKQNMGSRYIELAL